VNCPGVLGTTSTVLVVEDDADIRCIVTTVVARGGYGVYEAADGREALRAVHEKRPDLVVLDLGLPGVDGWQVLERIRDISDVPVLILTARDAEADTVRALGSGADDYLTKPFRSQELLARVSALLRRSMAPHAPASGYADRRLVVDPLNLEVFWDARQVTLTVTEFRLLHALVRHVGQVLSPEQLLAQAWNDPTGIGPDRVKYALMRLRRKLGWTDAGPIETVRGAGYRYRPALAPTHPVGDADVV
jgi:DNA-binding response OmpR family regulator